MWPTVTVMNHVVSGFDDAFTCRIIWSIKLHELHKGLVFTCPLMLSCPVHIIISSCSCPGTSPSLYPSSWKLDSFSHRPWPLHTRLFLNPDVSTGVTGGPSNMIKYYMASKSSPTAAPCKIAHVHALTHSYHKSGGAESLRHVWGQLNASPLQ